MSEINLTTPPPITQSANQIGGVTAQTAPAMCSDTDHEELEQDEYVDIIVGVFFDGTNNNKVNVSIGMTQKANGGLEERFKDTSYANDLSNVARGEPAYRETNTDNAIQFPLYIEGIGTEDNEDDHTKTGGAAGVGPTGIIAKVKKGCKELAAEIANRAGGRKIGRLTVDSFGFSRGAAAARNFIHEISKREGLILGTNYGELGKQLESNGVEEVRSFSIRFTGLYDTVASHGYLLHVNDTFSLSLKAVAKSVHVLQLAADDEHRANFRLTNINSAGGVEKFLPGVHSDIGGGYTDNTHEKMILAYQSYILFSYFENRAMEKERKYLVEQGWYKEEELPITDEVTPTFEVSINLRRKVLRANRMIASKAYSYIPLHIMTQYAINKEVDFDMGEIENYDYKIDDLLPKIKTRLEDYVMKNGPKLSFDNPEDKETIRELRNKYLHFSSHHNGPIFDNIEPMKPERTFWLNKRKRKIQNG